MKSFYKNLYFICLLALGSNYSAFCADIPESLPSPKQVNSQMENQVIPSLPPEQRKPAQSFWKTVWSEYTASNSFYGKVLDVHNRPVSKAKIKLNVIDASDEGYTEYSTLTNSRGIFEFHFKGKSAQVKIEQSDYYISKRNPFEFEFGDKSKENFYSPDSHDPIIFRALKKNISEPLIQGRGEWKLDRSGKPIYLNLFATSDIGSPENLSETDLIVRLFRPPNGANGKSDWTFNMEVPGENGGIFLTRDEFMFLAPKEGYKKSISLKQRDFDEGSKDGIFVYFYLCSREGKNYGRFRLNLGSQDGEGIDPISGKRKRISFMQLNYFMNPRASTNLEYQYGNIIKVRSLIGNTIKLIYPDSEKLKELQKEFSSKDYKDLDDGTSSAFDFFPD